MAIIAFYAAVHYVNAYLWERFRYEPDIQGKRPRRVVSDPRLTSCHASYELLKDQAYHARYAEAFTLSEQDARTLVERDFRSVEETVMRALGQPLPT